MNIAECSPLVGVWAGHHIELGHEPHLSLSSIQTEQESFGKIVASCAAMGWG